MPGRSRTPGTPAGARNGRERGRPRRRFACADFLYRVCPAAEAIDGMDPHFWDALSRYRREPLAQFPTLLAPMRRLGRALGGLELWIKRDDLIGFGFGGNKVRGLEFLLADALARGADTIVTGAGAQSNHVRATAAAAAVSGLRCVAVFWGRAPERVEGNYRLVRLLGAEVVFTGDADRSSVDPGILEVCDALSWQGRRPYSIPRGGASALGVLGHALAAKEVWEQCREFGMRPEAIQLATGSGSTQAGWLLGTRALGSPWQVEGFSVSRDVADARGQVARLAGEAAGLLGFDWQFAAGDVLVHGGFIGAGYGVPTVEGVEAIRRVARDEGVLLDPTYTGKAMAGLLDHRKRGLASYRSAVFLHTGGEPAFFAGEGEWLE